ncbi:MAG: transposase [Rhodoblastus sp.]|nr:transposase [Rhodoblastus sp.]MCC2107945.1 transposase [Hyphomicrobiales bacterium]
MGQKENKQWNYLPNGTSHSVFTPTLSLWPNVAARLEEFPEISSFWSVRESSGVLWTPAYFAGSVGGAPISILHRYIENQGHSRSNNLNDAPTSPC